MLTPRSTVIACTLLLNCGLAFPAAAAEPQDDAEAPTVLLTINGKPATPKQNHDIPPLVRQTPTLAPTLVRQTPTFAAETPQTSAPETPARQIAQNPATTANQSNHNLTPYAVDLCEKWGLTQDINNLNEAFNKWKSSTRRVEDIVEYLLAKQELTEQVMSLSFDVRRSTNLIDKELAKSQEKSAYLSEWRDKAIRYNTYANLVAGGLTGIIAGALEISDLTRFSFNTIDIAEGAGQAGLSLFAIKAEHAKHREIDPEPNVLACLIDPTRVKDTYPKSVVIFMQSPPPNMPAGKPRAELLHERWESLDFCLTHQGHRKNKKERISKITGTHKPDTSLSIDLLEDRCAMLQDLKAEIREMDNILAEVYELIRRY